MLRINQQNQSLAAKRYFEDGLSREDYFVKDDHEVGLWGGKGASLLGLSGPVKKLEFQRLFENILPDGSGPLTPRTRANRRVGYDINFHCPKSVSLLHALLSRDEVLQAFREAVAFAMKLIEEDMRTRVRVSKGKGDRATKNILFGEFTHRTARPIGGIPDPHLHAHCFTFNATYDPVEAKWKACEFGGIKKHASFYEAAFHSKLSMLIRGLGYEIEPHGRFFEVRGFPKTLIQKFSNRTAEIEQVAEARGIFDPEQKASLGAKTRKRKSEIKAPSFVKEAWNARVTEKEASDLLKLGGSRPLPPLQITAKDVLEKAAKAVFEKGTVVPEKNLLEVALRLSFGSLTLSELSEALLRESLTRVQVKGETFLTTEPYLKEESEMVSFVREGRGASRPLSPKPLLPATFLSNAEKATLHSVLTSSDRVILLRSGAPNVLRDALLSELKREGHKAVPLISETPSGSSELPQFSKTTVKDFLSDESLRLEAKGGVILLGEASKLGTKLMARLCSVAKELSFRIILVTGPWKKKSDTRDVIRILEERAGLGVTELERVRRSSGGMKVAVAAFIRGEIDQAIYHLNKLGAIRECKTDEILREATLEYARSVSKKKPAIVISQGHHLEVTLGIRSRLKSRKLLGRERVFRKLIDLKTTRAERTQAAVYKKGQVVVFFQSKKGFKAGHQYEIVGKDSFGNVLARKGLFVEALPLKDPDHFSLFERGKIKLARGDSIRITKTGRTKNEQFGIEKFLSPRRQAIRLENYRLFGKKAPDRRYRVPKDSIYRVTGFTAKGNIKLENGWVLDKSFGHLDYGYCVSNRARASAKKRRVIVVETLSSMQAGKNGEQFSLSLQGIEGITFFTDNREALFKSLGGARKDEKSSVHSDPLYFGKSTSMDVSRERDDCLREIRDRDGR